MNKTPLPSDQPSIKSFFSRIPREPLDAPGSLMAPGTILDKNLESGDHLEVLADERGSGDQKQTSELVVLGPQKSCITNNFYPTNTRVGDEPAPHLDNVDGQGPLEPAKKGFGGPKMTTEGVILVPKSLPKNKFYPDNLRNEERAGDLVPPLDAPEAAPLPPGEVPLPLAPGVVPPAPGDDHLAP